MGSLLPHDALDSTLVPQEVCWARGGVSRPAGDGVKGERNEERRHSSSDPVPGTERSDARESLENTKSAEGDRPEPFAQGRPPR